MPLREFQPPSRHFQILRRKQFTTDQALQTFSKDRSQWAEEPAQILTQIKCFKVSSSSSLAPPASATTNSLGLLWVVQAEASKFIHLETVLHSLSQLALEAFLTWVEEEESIHFRSCSEACIREACARGPMLALGSHNSKELKGGARKMNFRTKGPFSSLSTFVTTFAKCFATSS